MSELMRVDPFTTYNYIVQMGAIPIAGFSEVSAMTVETEVEKIRVGGINDAEMSLIGQTTYSDITLSKGMGSVPILWAWYQAVIKGYGFRSSITIIAQDETGTPRAIWMAPEAVPIKWEGPGLNASDSEVAIMSMTFTHNGILRML